MRKATLPLIVLSLALAGCATTGTKIDPQAAATIRVGESTCVDVAARLGAPSTDTVAANGQRTMIYTYAKAAFRATSYIPIVSLFTAGIDSTATSHAFVCDKDGKLIDTSATTATQSTDTGLLHGVIN